MIRKVFLWGIVLAATRTICAAPTELREVRLSTGASSAQITLYCSSQTAHQLFTLDHPNRVVVDLKDTLRGPGVRAPEGAGLVDGMRFGPRPRGGLRVVVQLKRNLPVRASWARGTEGAQLVIDLGSAPMNAVTAP